LIDPFLEPLGNDKKKVIETLRDLDIILVTHSHFDHMGNICEVLGENPNSRYVAIFEIMNHIQSTCKLSNEGIGMNIGGTWIYSKDKFRLPITLVHSIHSSDIGAPTGFIIQYPKFHVYHPGDTGLFTDMGLFGDLYGIDLSLLPIGGHFTMGIDEAVSAVKLLKTKYVIPMHYDTFPVIETDPNKFKEKVERETDAQVIILSPGEEYTFDIE
jgi:L-ascorbate metabolism protein UlaG (beta-lactamase superfamily)